MSRRGLTVPGPGDFFIKMPKDLIQQGTDLQNALAEVINTAKNPPGILDRTFNTDTNKSFKAARERLNKIGHHKK